MNLLYTITAYPPSIGGAQFYLHQLARQLTPSQNLNVATMWDTTRTDWLLGTTLNAPREPRTYKIDGVQVNRITLSESARRRMMLWVALYYPLQGMALPRIAYELIKEIAPLAESAEVIHNVRIGREGLSFASMEVARSRRIPFVFTPVHHPRWGGWLHRYYHQLYRQADAVIALTDAEKQTLIALGVEAKRIFVTGMGPAIAESSDGARFRSQHDINDAPMILFVGQKFAYKGFDALLHVAPLVWQKFPEARFVFVGPRTPYSRRLFARVSDPRIIELDIVSLQEKTDAYDACDIFCLPSSQESFGGVFTEAWSLSKPVIGADIPAVRSVIDEGENGFLVTPTPEQIAQRIITLLDDSQLRKQMGACGKAKVEARYSWTHLAEMTLDVYRTAMN